MRLETAVQEESPLRDKILGLGAGMLFVAAVVIATSGCAPDTANPAGDDDGGAGSGATAGTSGTSGGSTGAAGAPGAAGATGNAGTTGGSSDSGGASGAAGAVAGSSGGSGSGAGGDGGGSAGAGDAGGAGTTGRGGAAAGASGATGRGGAAGGAVAGRGGGGGGGAGTGGTTTSACATNQISSCATSGGQIACHFGGNPGNYEVTVELGASTAGDGFVEAESYRRMLGEVTTTAGMTKLFSFVTNVRVYEGEPLRPDQDSTYPKGTPGLDVYVRGTTPKLTSICQKPATAPTMIWIAGDSTVCDQAGTDYAGWGQHLPQFFGPPISVANYADSGESSGSFLGSAKLWGAIKAGMKSGDYVFIQLGHNDKDDSAATFRSNMTTMVTDAKNAGAHVVLFTPISRVGYTLAAEHVNSTGANLPQIIRDLGASQNVPVIDLTVTTWNWLQTIRWQDYFALGTDHTHTNQKGADVVAGFVRDGVRAQVPALASWLR